MAETDFQPYVGPRPFEEADQDRFFGREKEIRQLASLIVSRRVVVLYARSGAGKTSLLKAGLIPYLRRSKRLRVLPVTRVADELTTESRGAGANPYVLNVLSDLSDGEEPFSQGPAPLLVDGIERIVDGVPAPCLLIVDQLEELFNHHPELHAQRADFFVQLERCLHRFPRLSLLLSLREDSVAELDPYAGLLPDRLRSRFRLELLSPEAARSAMQEPVRAVGGEFPDRVAETLADELRTVRVQDADGHGRDVLGPWIEPVHLQVICRRWWNRRGGEPGPIAKDELHRPGSVDHALRSYYDERVAAVAEIVGEQERTLRDWIEQCLITDHGFRGQVMKGVESSEGLAHSVVDELVEARLIRVEKRRGAIWLELAHDRLIGPVRSGNARWRQNRLRPVQHRGELWIREGRPGSLLLRGGELGKELAWAKNRPQELTDDERQFLDASRQARGSRWLSRLVLAVTFVLLVALTLFHQERQRRKHDLARGLASQAINLLDGHKESALLLSLEAHRIAQGIGFDGQIAGSLLSGLLHQSRLTSFLHGHSAMVWTVAFEPSRNGPTMLASGGLDGQILRWDLEARRPVGSPLQGHDDGILSLSYDPEGRGLVSTGRDRQMLLWDLGTDPPQYRVLSTDRMISSTVVLDGGRLVTGDTQGEIMLWGLGPDGPREPRLVGKHGDWVTSLAAPDRHSRVVASGGADHLIRVWALDDAGLGSRPSAELAGHTDWITGLAWVRDGKGLASGSLDRTVRLWDVETLEEDEHSPLPGPTDRISGLAVGPDHTLAASTANGLIYLWDADTGKAMGHPLAGNLGLIRGLGFSPEGRMLASGNGSSVALWDLTDLEEGSGLGKVLSSGQVVLDLAFSPDGSTLALRAQGDGEEAHSEIQLLQTATGEPLEPLATYPQPAHDLTFSPEGALLELGDDQERREIRRWDLAKRTSTVLASEDVPRGAGHDPDRRALKRAGNFARLLEKTLEPERAETCRTVRVLGVSSAGEIVAAEAGPTPQAGDWLERWQGVEEPSRGRRIQDTECIRSLAISSDGQWLAVGTQEGSIEVIAVATLKTRVRMDGPASTIRSLAISSDGALLASGDDGGTIRLWDPTTGTELRPLVGHTDSIHALAFSPDHRLLASAGRDGTVMLWDVERKVLLGQPLRGHRGTVWSLAFDSAGESLASGGDDGARLWPLGFSAWRQRACRIANRNLTPEERRLYLGGDSASGEPLCPDVGAGRPSKLEQAE